MKGRDGGGGGRGEGGERLSWTMGRGTGARSPAGHHDNLNECLKHAVYFIFKVEIWFLLQRQFLLGKFMKVCQ